MNGFLPPILLCALFMTARGQMMPYPMRAPFQPQPMFMPMMPDYYDPAGMGMGAYPMRSAMMGGGYGGGIMTGMGGLMMGGTGDLASAQAQLMSFVNDKDNFQAQGCGWDGVRHRCTDGLNICKGGCRDFSNDIAHDCRCVPLGYMALLSLGRK